MKTFISTLIARVAFFVLLFSANSQVGLAATFTPNQSKVMRNDINNPPTIGTISTLIYAGKGQQVITIPEINDGDNAHDQTVTVTAISKDLNLLVIDSVSYKAGSKVAFIYVKDNSKTGTVDIEITLIDNGGTADGGSNQSVFTHSINISAFINPCANFVEFDTQHWEPRPAQTDLPTPGSYQKICATNTPIEKKERDFFWMKMYGYIIPSKTENYTFQGYSNEGFHMFMNLEGGQESNWSKLTKLVEATNTIWTSGAYLLEAGKPYYFEAYARDVVSTQPFWLKWSSESTPLDFIKGDNLSPFYDITKPTIPQNFNIVSTGLTDVLLGWNASTDNRNNLLGYNIFVNGVLQNSSPVTETTYKIEGLVRNTTYNVHIVAVDDSYNNSYPTEVLTFTTYDNDTEAPETPANVTSSFVTAASVNLIWNKSIDQQTEIRGYNVYKDNILIKELVKDTTVLVVGLTQKTSYSFTVEAVDANYNKSAKSSAYNVTTIAFDPNETRDGIRKGRLSIKLNPLTKFEGIGLNVQYVKKSIISNNLVSFGDFEGLQVDTMKNSNLKYYDKEVKNASFEKNLTTPYAGKVSAKISPVANGYFRCQINTLIDKRYTYLVRFAMKKDASFTGNVEVRLKGVNAGNTNSLTFTPATEWAMYEGELTTSYEGTEGVWNLDFTASSNGSFHLDNIQFVEKGNYEEGGRFAKRTLDLLRELKPPHIRRGAFESNSEHFKFNAGLGTGRNYSFADWVELANQLNAKAYITVGVGPKTDFFTSTDATMKKFIEYIAGDASTEGGKLRIAEGYGDLMTKSKGLFIELGNEVWGGATHNTGTFSNYSIYGNWARSAIAAMKGTAGFDTNKMKVVYSGRYPGLNYGLHKNLLANDKGEGDVLAISGYMGGNLNLDPAIPLSTSQLDYHKAAIAMIQKNIEGLKSDWREMLATCNRLLPMYMYEGNMTTNSYYGSVGQAVSFADYYTTVPLYGVPDVSIFSFVTNQWKVIENAITYRQMPLFTIAKYINNYCTGALLETSFTTSFKIKNEKGLDLSLDPVGVKAYTDSTSYSVALFSRDFENDYQVQVDIPDFIGNSTTCKKIVISGNHFTDREALVTEEMMLGFADSLLITVPKFSVVILKFEGNDQNFEPAPVYQDYKKISNLKITQAENKFYINTKRGRLTLGRTYTPNDAFSTIMKWELLDNETVKAYFVETSTGIMLYSTGVSSGNGTIRVVCSSTDLSGMADTVSIAISNQGPTSIDILETEDIDLYPNPTKDYLHVNISENISGHLSVMDMNGRSLISEAITNKENVLQVESLQPGIYLLRISTERGFKILKFVKN